MADEGNHGASAPPDSDPKTPSQSVSTQLLEKRLEVAEGEALETKDRLNSLQKGMSELSCAMDALLRKLTETPESKASTSKVKSEKNPPPAVIPKEEKITPDPSLMAQPKEEAKASPAENSETKEEEEVGNISERGAGIVPERARQAEKEKTDLLKKIPEYRGDIPWEDYYTQFQILMQSYGWDPEEAVLFLIASLRGPALSVLGTLPKGKIYELSQVIKALERRFGRILAQDVYKVQLKTRKRRRDEPLPHLAQEIEGLANRAYPSNPFILGNADLMQDITKDYFINALTDRQQQLYVMQSHPEAISDALSRALEYEAFQKVLVSDEARCYPPDNKFPPWKPRPNGGNNGGNNGPKPETTIIRARPARFPERSRPGRPNNDFQGHCWHCGLPGHRRVHCPKENVNNHPLRREAGIQGRERGGERTPAPQRGPAPRGPTPGPRFSGNGVPLVENPQIRPVVN